ncbi:uncharacterized protein LOC128743640 isoform X2 [Sabethes cyaneus]|uniref:uncharacterized protein LOC128743640 isoform X2 n=1 Tax=Sabethes cyaneus TaxID=53552 RepID=UPI00237DEAE1|nr:uncharacterized protein LOC128743640 isoform X2 [Sabethes cyaneus]
MWYTRLAAMKRVVQLSINRGSRKLKPLPIYSDNNNDDDLSEFGLGFSTSESSDKMSSTEIVILSEELSTPCNTTPNTDISEYTYEGAIEVYKSRISRASHSQSDQLVNSEHFHTASVLSSENPDDISSIEENRNVNNEHRKSADSLQRNIPKIDFMKRKQLFEKEPSSVTNSEHETRCLSGDTINSFISVKERLSVLQSLDPSESDILQRKLPEVSFTDLKNRLEVFERDARNTTTVKNNCSTRTSIILPKCSTIVQTNSILENAMHDSNTTSDQLSSVTTSYASTLCNAVPGKQLVTDIEYNENIDSDHEDSGIHTTDVSCSVSQADEQNDELELHASGTTNMKAEISDSYIDVDPTTSADNDEVNDANILDDALEMAFQEIDNIEGIPMCGNKQEPIYQNIKNTENQSQPPELSYTDEPYYQVPKCIEPYYEVPKTKPIPLYENVDIIQPINIVSEDSEFVGDNSILIKCLNKLQPPKEKPPPPPPSEIVQDNVKHVAGYKSDNEDDFKRLNSIKRIKKDLCHKRSSFLGIEGTLANDTNDNEVVPYSTHTRLISNNNLQLDEKYLERQTVMKSGLFENSDTAESRDSGVSENHSRQSSDLFYALYNDSENFIKPKLDELEILKFNAIENHQSEHYLQADTYQHTRTEHMYDNKEPRNAVRPTVPPVKPLRTPHQPQSIQDKSNSVHQTSLVNVPNSDCSQYKNGSFFQSENQVNFQHAFKNNNSLIDLFRSENTSNESLNNIMEPNNETNYVRAINDRNLQLFAYESNGMGSDYDLLHKKILRQRSYTDCSPQCSVKPPKHGQELKNNSYNQHWSIQEPEQRRVDQQDNIPHTSHVGQQMNINRKSLPESVIQTITQRVQNLGIGSDKRWQPEIPTFQRRLDSDVVNNYSSNARSTQSYTENDEKVLSVSGKKKCSNCNNELGRGAAMVIESLGLLYHIECFKCCVCHIRLGDGFKGTDVRVRKYKLHCQNCFSSEDGVKFSCV